jgi:hypothetical protein
MRLGFFSVLAVLGATACASSGRGAAEGGEDTVQLVIINQYSGTVTAYAVWGAGRNRLGDVGSNRERTFFPERRSDRIAVGFEAIGAPPAGTSSGANRFGPRGGGDPDPSSPSGMSESIAVVNGDAVEVRISAAGIITVRRLVPGL